MQIQNIGRSDGGSYETVPRTMGEDMLCLRADVSDVEQIRDGIFVTSTAHQNDRMMYYCVEKVGPGVTEKTGVVPGDYVYVDMLARFADTFPVSFTTVGGILFKTDKNGKEAYALRGRIIVNVVEPSEKVNEFGLVQLSDIDPYGEVVSIGEGCEDRGFSVGDRVSLQTSDDSQMYMLGTRKLLDYDYRTPSIKYKA